MMLDYGWNEDYSFPYQTNRLYNGDNMSVETEDIINIFMKAITQEMSNRQELMKEFEKLDPLDTKSDAILGLTHEILVTRRLTEKLCEIAEEISALSEPDSEDKKDWIEMGAELLLLRLMKSKE